MNRHSTIVGLIFFVVNRLVYPCSNSMRQYILKVCPKLVVVSNGRGGEMRQLM